MEAQSSVRVPRVAIRFCTQCKWNLRAAYYAQELLQTFSTTLGEVSLIPMTGGIFDITLWHMGQETTLEQIESSYSQPSDKLQQTLVWDRKRDGGFPEVKDLKNRVRNLVDPERDMGHIDRSLKKPKVQEQVNAPVQPEKTRAENIRSENPNGDSSASQMPVAAGGENLGFGDNPHTSTSRTESAARDDCEDCK